MNFITTFIFLQCYRFISECSSSKNEKKTLENLNVQNGMYVDENSGIRINCKITATNDRLDKTNYILNARSERSMIKTINPDILLNGIFIPKKSDNESLIVQIKKNILEKLLKNIDEEFERYNYLRFSMDIDHSLFDDYYLLVFDGQDTDLIHRTISNGKTVDKKTSGIVKNVLLEKYYKPFDISKRKDILIQLFKNCLEKKLISIIDNPKPYVFVFANDVGYKDNFLTDVLHYPERVTSKEFTEVLNELKIPFSKFTVINNKYYNFINQVRSNNKDKRLNETNGMDVARKNSRSCQKLLHIREFSKYKNMNLQTFKKLESEDVFCIQNSDESFDFFGSKTKKELSQGTAENTILKDSMFINKTEEIKAKIEEEHVSLCKNLSLKVPEETIQSSSSKEAGKVNMELIFDFHFDRFQLFGIIQEKSIGKVFAIKFDEETFYELIHYNIKKFFEISNELSDITSMFINNIHNLSDFNLNFVKQYQAKEETEKIKDFVYNLIFLNMSLYHRAITNLYTDFKKVDNLFINLFRDHFSQRLIKKFSEDIRDNKYYEKLDSYLLKKIRLLHNNKAFKNSKEYALLQDMIIEALPKFKKLVTERKEEVLKIISYFNEGKIIHLRNVVCADIREIISKFLPSISINVNFRSNFINQMNLIKLASEDWDVSSILKQQTKILLDSFLVDNGEDDKAIFVK